MSDTDSGNQTLHTYFLIPETSGAPTVPGAYFRLGGYSDVESGASDPSVFYPRQHNTDAGGDPLTTSTGGAQGIVLACSGRMLLHAGEKFYLHSADAMHIDTQKTLIINADEDITINSLKTVTIVSAEDQSITIDAGAGTGEMTQTSAKVTRNVAGDEYEYIDKSSYKYTQANTYSIMLGHDNKITCGTRFTIWLGVSLTFNIALDVAFSAVATVLFYLFKFELGLLKIDLVKWKGEWKDGEFLLTNTTVKGEVIKGEQIATEVENVGIILKTVATEAKNKICEVATGAAHSVQRGVQNAINGISSYL